MSATCPLKALVRILALPLFACCIARAADGPASSRREVLQPVHEYFNIREAVSDVQEGEHVLNGFLNYTHIGTDFGFLGPSEPWIRSEAGGVYADLSGTSQGWAGVWHSLNGLARERVPLDLRAVYSPLIGRAFQPRVTGVQAKVSGTGKVKLEFKAAAPGSASQFAETSIWERSFELPAKESTRTLSAEVDAEAVRFAHYLNWVAEPGSQLHVDSISLRVELPEMDFPTYVFLASYAKLARCYSEGTGLVRDRAHTSDESLNNVPATGLFALATVAAHEAGIVDAGTARATVRRISDAIAGLPRKHGVLPHFVQRVNGEWAPIAGSEFSTVDTALCLFSLRMAANAMGDAETSKRVLELLRGLEMNTLRDAEGFVLHGLRNDGSPLASVWKDWGGETALVLMMQRVAAGPAIPPRMDDNGRSYRGVGFITELPSLFFPEFNTHARAQAGLVDWLAYRRGRLAEQKAYFPKHAPGSVAAQLGFYGLSAGEGRHGEGYLVSGVEDAGQRTIHPHYILMSGLLEPSPAPVYEVLEKLEQRGWFTPLGLVENIAADGKSYLPMIGSLNAGFEAVSAYHLLAKHRRQENAIYAAAKRDLVLEDAVRAVFAEDAVAIGGTEAE
jgi:hypothetical protein